MIDPAGCGRGAVLMAPRRREDELSYGGAS